MKTCILRTAMVITIATVWQVMLFGTETIQWVSAETQFENVANSTVDEGKNKTETAVTQGARSGCESCEGCNSGNCGAPGCDGCPRLGVVGMFGFESFKGISDGGYQSNFGAVTGLNTGVPLGALEEYGLGWQLGFTYGAYDWDGRSSTALHTSSLQQQTFVTTGIFRKGNEDRRVSAGLVYDWMINDQWGLYGIAPTLGQWRGQAEYALSDYNSLGGYFAIRDLGHSQLVNHVPILNRGVDHFDVFWHHKFVCGADSRLWIGVPDRTKLGGRGSLGEWIVGANLEAPITSQLSLFGNVQYMRPSATAGAAASIESCLDHRVGSSWYPGRNARTSTVNGGCWMPYIPVANNSTFMVDQSPVVR
jgi:hypothetical protein